MSVPFLLSGASQPLSDWMGIAEASNPFSKASAQFFVANTTNRPGVELFDKLFQVLESRWRTRSRTRLPSIQNWRFTKNKKVSIKTENRSPEVRLEKWITNMTGSAWANGIPTASGLFDGGGRKANIDLAWRGEGSMTFIELKWDSDHCLYAAFELAGYAVAWVQARTRAEEMGYSVGGVLRPALSVQSTRWVVLAPNDFFRGPSPEYLDKLQTLFDSGISEFFGAKCPGVTASFRFVRLPPCPDFRGTQRPPARFVANLEARLV